MNGKYIEVKAYETWLQIARVDGVDYGGCMDIPVKEFKAQLAHALAGEPVAIN